MSLNLKNLDVVAAAERATRTELENPFTFEPLLDDEGKPYYVDHLGEDSHAVKAVDRKQADRRADQLRKSGGQNPLYQEVLEKQAVERLTAATVGWYLPPFGEETFEFSPVNARRVYSNDGLAWIAEQVAKSMKDRSRFLLKASDS